MLKLTLHASSYDWQFQPIAGSTWSDSGSGPCHGPPGGAPPPAPRPAPPPTAPTAPVLTGLRVTPRHASRHTTFRFKLSEAARVRFGIARRRPAGFRRVGRLVTPGVTGANARAFNCTLRGRRLRPGVYRARAVARDVEGYPSKPRKVRFRIVR